MIVCALETPGFSVTSLHIQIRVAICVNVFDDVVDVSMSWQRGECKQRIWHVLCARVVPAILNEAIPATTQQVDAEIQAVMRCSGSYTALAEKLLEAPPSLLAAAAPVTPKLLRDAIYNARQHEAFLRILLVQKIHLPPLPLP